MSRIRTVKNLWKSNKRGLGVALFNNIAHSGILNWMSDKSFLNLTYWVHFGRSINWENPQTFNEKLQWLKVYNRNPVYTQMVDKYDVKDYVAKVIGDEYIIPTIGVWDRVEDIPFDKLPDQYVIKCTHDSGSVCVCNNKNSFDVDKAKKKLAHGLRHNLFYWGREWPYKNVMPRIIAERYLEDEQIHELRDYKFFCFGGKVKMFKIDFDRFTEHHANYYDINLNLLPFGEADFPPKPEKSLDFPSQINKMFQLAEKLSHEIPFLRVDFYQVNNQVYFGELTFFPATGMGKWTDDKWDVELGSWINLPTNKTTEIQ